MDQITNWFSLALFSFKGESFTLGNLLLLLGILLLYFLVGRIVIQRIKKAKTFRKKAITEERRASLLLSTRSVLFLVCLISILLSLPFDELFRVDQNAVRVVDLINIVIILVLARALVWYFRRWFQRLAEENKVPVDKGRRFAISQIFGYAIYVLAVLLALSSLRIDINLIIASAAGLFVGVGLALQHTIDDLISGVIILFDGTLSVGDMVVVETLDLEGKVSEIKLRTTIIETLDNFTVVVPNSQITKSNVVNWNFNHSETRFKIGVGVAYGSDVALVRKALLASAQSHGKVLKKPAPIVWFVDFGDSSLQFELLFWTRQEKEIYHIKSDLRFKIEAEFRRHRIRIPFPQRDLHIVSDFRFQGEENPALEKDSGRGEKSKPEAN